ncbi:MAG: EscN/YscN/HrcN family type III secretion system ATPase, partial [Planctomycetes bacterium]|nr:EscN/YscN/HrcN family type III secretion system ATPase [Planctomycetota bacterium]
MAHNRPVARGRVAALSGVLVEAVGMRCASGDRCTIHTQRGEVGAEVVGFRDGVTLLMPTDNLPGVAPFDPVVGHAEPFVVPTGDQLLGRVVDAFGAPLDGGPPIRGIDRPVVAAAPHALSRAPVVEPLQTGVPAIDGLPPPRRPP